MSLLFATGFGLTTTVADLFEATGTGGGGSMSSTGGRNNGASISQSGNNAAAIKNLGVNAATCVVGFAVKGSGLSTGNDSPLCAFWDSGTEQFRFTWYPDGTVHWGANVFNLSLGVFHYVEIKAVFSNASGVVIVNVDGVEVLNVTGADTQATGNAYATRFSLGAQGNGNGKTMVYDDLYIMDGTDGTATQGAAFNSFLGDVRVDDLLPESAGDSTQWTPSTGNNYQCVDETTRNDDTDYVSSSNIGDKDLYNVPSLSSATGTVKAVLVTMRARKDDAGTRTIKAKVKHGGVEGNGVNHGLSTSYAYLQDVFGINPSTSAAWTIAEVNAAQVGVEVVA